MGNSVSRPSCLGEKSPRAEDALKGPCSASLNEEDRAGAPEKAGLSPRVVENGCNVALEGDAKSSPLPKQNNLEKLWNCCPLQTQQEGAVAWSPPESLGASRGWKLHPTRELTEVTEVTETVVTEIVEVTEYPGGDKSREASVTRMVKELPDVREALAQAAALPGGMQGAGLALETAGKLGAWVSEVEDLMGQQKPPSGDAKVVKVQLQEQKLLLRLLEERTPHIGRLCPPLSAEPAEGQEPPRGLASLQEKWPILVQEAEARHSCLQQILPAASVFQESVEDFQDWLSLTEQKLAQLWGAPGSLTRRQEAHQQIQNLRREVQSKPAELEEALEHGRQLLRMVAGEEGQLVQGKMDSLQLRLLLVDQRSSDALQQMEQILEASSHLGLGLQPPEKEQLLPGSQAGDGSCPQAPAGGEKRLSAETLPREGRVERPVAVAKPQLSLCPTDVQEGLQPLVTALQEGTESLGHQSPACTLQLAQGQLLKAQHAEVQAELSQWLEETQQAVVAFSPGSSSIGCNAFWEQQEALEGLQEATAKHKPQMGKLRCITTWLAELGPWQEAPLWQRLQAAEERYSSLREQVQQAAAMLQEALPQYSQLSKRLELVAGSLEWLQGCTRHPLALRGDPAWLQEQLWRNSLRLAELEKLPLPLKTLCEEGPELQATLQSITHPAVQERMQDLQNQWQLLWQLEKDREASLQELLALAGQFWPGLAKLARALSNTQRIVLDLEDTAASSPKDIQAKLVAMQALREEGDFLQSELDPLGAWAMELMSSCGDPEKPTVTKSLDDLYSSWNSLNRMWGERQKHLEDQLQALVTDPMQRLLAWLVEAERWVAEDFLGGGDPVQVEQELSELKLEEMASFDFTVWRKRYLQWISHRKSRVLDIFRSIDRGQDGRIPQQEFVRRVLASQFPTSLPEMKAVAKIFDVNRDGFIDYYEFISALHPSRDILHRAANVDHIQEEVNRQVIECNCVKRFQVEKISAGRYRFGECQQLRVVQILRSTLMVRVGGGWAALDEFLVKNDPCRVKGRTNLKINERYLSPGNLRRKGTGSQSAPASKMLSHSCSTSGLSLYRSASVPTSPVPRKALLHRTRSGDRCPHSCSPAGVTRAPRLAFAAGAAGPDAEAPGHPRREAAPSDVPAP